MTKIRAEVLTRWVGDGVSIGTAHRPQLKDDYVVLNYEDVTRQPSANLHPDPNMYTVLIECDPAVMNAIEIDSNYVVIWQQEVLDA